jgi:hypothetical protein
MKIVYRILIAAGITDVGDNLTPRLCPSQSRNVVPEPTGRKGYKVCILECFL